MMQDPLVYVLVINWNGLDHLEECFESLLLSGYGNVRFVLIDNASDDDSVEFVRSRFGDDGRVEILECPTNLGWSGGNNVGLERALEAGADYVFLLNNDTATSPDAIEKLVARAEADPTIGSLAPKILLYDSPELLNSVGLDAALTGSAWDVGVGRLDGPRWNDTQDVIGVCGAAWFVRAEVLRKTGLLPTDFDIYLDDLDLCLRIWNAGYAIRTCPEAVVRHKFSATMGGESQSRRKYYLNTRNRMRVIQRNYPVSRAAEIAWAYGVGECRAIGRALLDGDFWRLWAHVRSWGAGLAYVPSALRERGRRKREGLDECRFWHLLRKDLHFFPGVEFPEEGWYRERMVEGKRIRPMSARACYAHKGGRLRLTQMNCYPELGPLEIQVTLDGDAVATLNTTGWEEMILDLPSGTLEFVAGHIFEAEETGELVDFGGWAGVEEHHKGEGPRG